MAKTTDKALLWAVDVIESAEERAAAGDLPNAVADAAEAVRRTQSTLHELLTRARAKDISWEELSTMVRRDPEYLRTAHDAYNPEAYAAVDLAQRAGWRPLG